ncbi:MAG: U32 family peptidase [Firmicutes bacterium]|nr:U32 family peptidase [Bacillota bacterium]MBR7148899.1 U32 family peptidase [Bacillota bacterium]
MNKIELLAPAGDLEKLKIAIDYGADAVYLAGELFGLRAGAKNFSIEEMEEGVAYAHERGRKVHLTLNIFAHNEDITALESYLDEIAHIPFDAFIISDAGIISLVMEKLPGREIHLSTQANTTNYRTAEFWHRQGVKRVVLGREMSLEDIRNTRKNLSPTMEIEAFVHGAMCISYSGRCLLSNFMTERGANQGQCAHPCRYKYALMEEKRPGEFYPVEEDDRGTYIFNSKDMCMIEHIPELIESGLASLKIEGRMKSVFYVATVVRAYRQAIDAYYEDPEGWTFKEEWLEELKKVSNRHFTNGFYFNKPRNVDQNYETSAYYREFTFIGLVLDYDPETKLATVEQRNKISEGDFVEVFGPGNVCFTQTIQGMTDEEGTPISAAPHAQQIVKIPMAEPVGKNFMVRRHI